MLSIIDCSFRNVEDTGWMVPAQDTVEPEFAAFYRFPFDGFQLEAMAVIREGDSVMVAAPTSAGKTVVAEYGLWRALSRREKAIYTTPIKALSNQKRRELEDLFPGRVGLLTGDRSENRNADIVVMTTEVLRNMLLEDPASVAEVGCVVFDEVHYLADPGRGTIWEESIISAPRRMQLVCLSATVANAEEIADWISQTQRPIVLIRRDERPVPLEHYVFAGGSLRLIRDANGKRVHTVARTERKGRGRSAFPDPAEVILGLRRADQLPAIWFAFTRRGVELDAEACAEALPELRHAHRTTVEAAIAGFLNQMPEEDRTLGQILTLAKLLRHGVGFHHAGILPQAKELVERLFAAGELAVVCATDTLSVGINMPARTVVISSMTRPVAGLLTPNDFSQLTGRAGRRGIDERGAVVLLPNPFHDFERSYAEVTGPLEPVRSAFTLRYSTLISVFRGSDPEQRLATLVAASLRQFQLYGDARKRERDLHTINSRLREIPHSSGDPASDQLAEYLMVQDRLSAEEKAIHRGRSNKDRRARGRADRRVRSDAYGPSRQLQSLRALMRSHPVHRQMRDPDFAAGHAEEIDLLRQRNRIQRTLEASRRERDRSADTIAHAVTNVLVRLGYVEGGQLTEKAAGLREIVAPSGIVISEMYHAGMLDGLAPAELAEVISWFANDVDRKRYNSFRLPHHLRVVQSMAVQSFNRVSRLEERDGIQLAQGPSAWFWGVALAWCQGASVAQVTQSIEMADGDVVSVLNKTIDLMDQVKGMLTSYSEYGLLGTLSRGRGLLNRGMVAMIRTEGEPDWEEDNDALDAV